MKDSRAMLIAGATMAGLALGWLVAQGRQRHHRADLFSDQPGRRSAALGYLAGRATPENVRLLRDYVRWETRPNLRRRAEAVARRLEARLG